MTTMGILVLRSCWRAFITIGIMALSLVTASAESYKGYTRPEAIITAKELHELMAKNSNVIVIAVASATQYHRGHIPGSIRVWRKDYEAPHGNGKEYPFEGMLANKSDFEKFARKLGINNDSTVVIYDYQYDATRLWWAFYCYGKKDIKILDGGIQAWKKAGYSTKLFSKKPAKRKGNFVATPQNLMLASLEDVKNMALQTDVKSIQLFDNREREEWDGRTLKRGAYNKGRIPNATFLSWKAVRNKKTNEFKDANSLRKSLTAKGLNIEPGVKKIFYCQSGVRTTQVMFALYLIGVDPKDMFNYDGSWIEWSYHKDNPIINESAKSAGEL